MHLELIRKKEKDGLAGAMRCDQCTESRMGVDPSLFLRGREESVPDRLTVCGEKWILFNTLHHSENGCTKIRPQSLQRSFWYALGKLRLPFGELPEGVALQVLPI